MFMKRAVLKAPQFGAILGADANYPSCLFNGPKELKVEHLTEYLEEVWKAWTVIKPLFEEELPIPNEGTDACGEVLAQKLFQTLDTLPFYVSMFFRDLLNLQGYPTLPGKTVKPVYNDFPLYERLHQSLPSVVDLFTTYTAPSYLIKLKEVWSAAAEFVESVKKEENNTVGTNLPGMVNRDWWEKAYRERYNQTKPKERKSVSFDLLSVEDKRLITQADILHLLERLDVDWSPMPSDVDEPKDRNIQGPKTLSVEIEYMFYAHWEEARAAISVLEKRWEIDPNYVRHVKFYERYTRGLPVGVVYILNGIDGATNVRGVRGDYRDKGTHYKLITEFFEQTDIALVVKGLRDFWESAPDLGNLISKEDGVNYHVKQIPHDYLDALQLYNLPQIFDLTPYYGPVYNLHTALC